MAVLSFLYCGEFVKTSNCVLLQILHSNFCHWSIVINCSPPWMVFCIFSKPVSQHKDLLQLLWYLAVLLLVLWRYLILNYLPDSEQWSCFTSCTLDKGENTTPLGCGLLHYCRSLVCSSFVALLSQMKEVITFRATISQTSLRLFCVLWI